MSDIVVAINAGSSSIKFSLFEAADSDGAKALLFRGEASGIGNTPKLEITTGDGNPIVSRSLAPDANHEAVIGEILKWVLDETAQHVLIAAGHRVVHGGMEFNSPVLIDDAVLQNFERLVPLAPLHQPHNISAIRALMEILPALPQVACFDTGFHHTNSSLATTFALPRALTEEGVRRYGFHGLSYEYIASVLPDFAGNAANGRVIVAHLGHGASMCAMSERKSIATTMGFTALDGLMMGKRCGSIDPGVLLYLLKEKSMDYEALSNLLYHRSGLLGVSGISDDLRDLSASSAESAKEAIDLFVYRIKREMGSLFAALGGLDVLVFTGGIGEHAANIRERVCEDAAWADVKLNTEANKRGEVRIGARDSSVQVFTIPTNEDPMIARHTMRVISDHHSKHKRVPSSGSATSF